MLHATDHTPKSRATIKKKMVALLQELFTVAICAAVLLGSVASDLPSLVVGLHQARRSLGAALPPHPRHGPHLLFKKEASQGASEALGGTQEQFPVLSLREAIETLQSRTDGVVLHHTRGQVGLGKCGV